MTCVHLALVWRLPGEVFRVISSDPFYYYFFFGALFFSFLFFLLGSCLRGSDFYFFEGRKINSLFWWFIFFNSQETWSRELVLFIFLKISKNICHISLKKFWNHQDFWRIWADFSNPFFFWALLKSPYLANRF